MSVLSCSRTGCENIMCDRWSYRYGYICNECFDELIHSRGKVNISDFMQSEKQYFYQDGEYERICENEFKIMER